MGVAVPHLIQICASQNDLFGLDAQGQVYRYNFNTSRWIVLGPEETRTTDGRYQSEQASAVDDNPS